jgi:glycerophosphoryl diester phosphodiesterase
VTFTKPGKETGIVVCGHRGASGHAPENTLAAFRLAREMGASWIEFDVQLSADGIPIILHDDTLERTTDLGRPLRPTQLTLAELKALDAGSWFSPQFANERLPTLDEVLEEFGETLGLNIEIKSEPGLEADNGIERKIAEAVRRYNLQDKVLISSFDPSRLMTLHAFDPELRLGALYTDRTAEYIPDFDPFALAQLFEAVALHPPHRLVNSSLVARAHEKGMTVNTWTANETTDMRRLIGLGVNMIITNYPDRLAALVAEQ